MDTNNMNNGYENYYGSPQDNLGNNGGTGSDLNGNKPSKKKKEKSGTGKKVFAGALIGLFFGLFAGLGFAAVNIAGSHLFNSESTTVASSSKSKDKTEDDSDSKEKADDKKDTAEASTDKDETKEESNIKLAEPESDGKTEVYDVTEVVKSVMPSVVAVNSKVVSTMQYFGQTYSQESTGAGSGIIIGQNDSELLIVTNYHVVEDSEELSVQFIDEETATAQIKGTDSGRDLAVIAVQLDDIKSSTMNEIAIAEMGDSDALEVGESVIAIGNALGYGQSVTTGVVSALNRSIAASTTDAYGESTDIGSENTFIQTDAAINPGNSGGALLNASGQVIGINSNKIGGSTVDGIGYAIPISDAKPIIEELMQKDTKLKVSEDSKGYLGITGVTVESEYSEIYGMPVGVYVSSVTEGSGADEAGLIRGDIIVALNGEEISSMEELKGELEYYAQGTEVTVTIMQGSPTGYQSKDVQVTLGAASLAQ